MRGNRLAYAATQGIEMEFLNLNVRVFKFKCIKILIINFILSLTDLDSYCNIVQKSQWTFCFSKVAVVSRPILFSFDPVQPTILLVHPHYYYYYYYYYAF